MTPKVSAAAGQTEWLTDLNRDDTRPPVDGLVRVADYNSANRPPEEVASIERARMYNAHSVFFAAPQDERPLVPQAFIYVSNDGRDDPQFAELHKRLWSWGGVPLLYRKVAGEIQLYRCAHDPDFLSKDGTAVCKPFKTLQLGARIASLEAWWDAEQLRNNTLWDDPRTCRLMLSATKSAHRNLIDTIQYLYHELIDEHILPDQLCRRLLILSLLIAYLEERDVLRPDFFANFRPAASRFFEVLRDGPALVAMLGELERRFNGNVFALTNHETTALLSSEDLERFARFVEGYEEPGGQLALWQLYSFKDLPVELLSQVYQVFVLNSDTAIYTPPSLVRLILEEALPWERLDQLVDSGQIVLDPACGSGVFLVEVYKRLVLHWRRRNGWARPDTNQLRQLLEHVHGVDVEEAAIELATFSLCLAMCDALEPAEIRSSLNLFPRLEGTSLHNRCFFEAKECGLIAPPVGAVVGNPPFRSDLTTPGARRRYDAYVQEHGHLADKQLAYLFLHEAMTLLADDGVAAMIQPAGFLYNLHAGPFRRTFLARWNVRELLDFVSIRGLFKKGHADPKVIVVVATTLTPTANSKVLHAVFRRSGRATAEQGFDIDYYDLHWVDPRSATQNVDVWRANLLGGGRILDFLTRLRRYRTLRDYATTRGWDFGEGYIAGKKGTSNPAGHLIGARLLPTQALSALGIDATQLEDVPNQPIKRPKSASRFTPPMLLVKEHQDLHNGLWSNHYLAYKDKIVGFAAPATDLPQLSAMQEWLSQNSAALRAYVAGISLQLFSQRATTIGSADIYALPYPEERSLDLSDNESLLIEDLLAYGRDLVRKGGDSAVLRSRADEERSLPDFAAVFCGQLNTVYPSSPIRPLEPYIWAGVICQPFVFGSGNIDWTGVAELRGKLDVLLRESRGSSLMVTRIARIYDRNFVFLMKPDRLRFWLRSVALRDADDVLADLRAQGL